MTKGTDELGEMDPASAVLFLGSGFSLSARNISNESPPNGAGLRRHFIKQLGLPDDTAYDLQVLSEEFAEGGLERLHDELYRIFRISALCDDQKAILSEPWRRIYTTNYDDSVELYRLGASQPSNTFDVSDPLPNKLPHGAVIHLHGSIRIITQDNVLSSLVLGEASYVNQYLLRSPWYDQFQRDIAFAGRLYIVGYSLADYHIAALLLADPKLAAKTVFIHGPVPDAVLKRRTANYGQTMFIGTEGFASALARATRPTAPRSDSLRSFRSLSPTRDKRSSAKPTAAEVYDLLVYGNFDGGRLARSQPSEDYAIARAARVREAADALEVKSALVIDGRLGNGKTIFLHLLAFELSARGWACYLFKPGHPEVAQEFAALTSVDRLVVFIENYSGTQDALRGLREALPDARLVVEVRTGTYEVRFHEITELLPRPFGRVSLNVLSQPEVHAFGTLCQRAGLRPPNRDQKGDMRDMLLDLFGNQSIRDRVQAALAPLFEKRATYRILTMTMLIALHQGSVSAAFVRSVTGDDPFAVLKPHEDLTNEVLELSADNLRARSAVFSSFVITSFIAPNDIADAVVELTLAAASRRAERPYRVLMSNMMAFTSLRRTLRGKGEPVQIILTIYERLRYDERVNGEPLFWLQYAIAMAELPKLDIADEFIDTAYRRAAELRGFQTYQIDTQAFRIALMRAVAEPRGRAVFNIERILSGIERIDAMLADSSHRAYAIRVLEGVHDFVVARGEDLASGERVALQFWLLKVAKSLFALPDDYKAATGSEAVRRTVDAAASLFVTS